MNSKPLWGKRVVITRAADQSAGLEAALSAVGAECILFPTLVFEAMPDARMFDSAVARLSDHDWLVLTSSNGVHFFFERLGQQRLPESVRIAVVGSATNAALAKLGYAADLMPEEFTGGELAQYFESSDVALDGRSILLPQGNLARPLLKEQLEAQGADVHAVSVYQTLPAQPSTEAAKELQGGVDAITFTSPSTIAYFSEIVQDFARQADGINIELDTLRRDAAIACIGPVTAKAAQDLGWDPHVIADPHTAAGLVQGLLTYFNRA